MKNEINEYDEQEDFLLETQIKQDNEKAEQLNQHEQQQEEITISIDGLSNEQEDYLLESWREQELEARFIK